MRWYHLLIFIPIFGFSQTSYQVIDTVNNKGIPFVNIWIKNSQKGTTADETGKFQLDFETTDTLVFSAVGHKSKTVDGKSISQNILMHRNIEQLKAVVIRNPKSKKEQSFGTFHKSDYRNGITCTTQPWMVGSMVSYRDDFKTTPYIKEIRFSTRTKVKEAKFALRIYRMADSLFENPIHQEPIYGYAKRGKKISSIDLENKNILFPEEGLAFIVEFLLIDANRRQQKISIVNRKKTKQWSTYFDPVFSLRADKQLSTAGILYSQGHWYKPATFVFKNSELAIQLVMTD